MTDKKPPLDFGLEDLDWDAAIAEWDQNTVVPGGPESPSAYKAPASGAAPAPALSPPTARALEEKTSEHKAPITARPSGSGTEAEVEDPTIGLRSPGAPRPAASGGLGQLFKGRDGSREADASADEIGETTRQSKAPPPAQLPELPQPPPAPTTEDQGIDEELLSKTVAAPDGDAAIDALLTVSSEGDEDGPQDANTVDAAIFAGIPADDDAPTQYIRGKASPPRPAPAPTVTRRPEDSPPASQGGSDLAETIEGAAARPPDSGRTGTYVRKEDEDAPTRLRNRSELPSIRPPEEPEVEAPAPPTFDNERAARDLLDDDAKAAIFERAQWFEEEGRAMTDPALGARTLVTASELFAMCGNLDDATRLAMEARDVDPRQPLAHWQARALLPRGMDVGTVVAALDSEARQTSSGPHRLHTFLVGAEHLHLAADDDGAARRLEQAARLVPDDARAYTTRAARALSRNDYVNPALRSAEASALASLSLGVGTALRLRGAERSDGDAGEILPNDSLRRAREAMHDSDFGTAATLLAELVAVPELAKASSWLAAALGMTQDATRTYAASWLKRLLGTDDALARRAIAALGVEIGDGALVDAVTSEGDAFAPHERATLAALMRLPLPQGDTELTAIEGDGSMAALASAVAAVGLPSSAADLRARAKHAAGRESSRKLVTLGRLLGTEASDEDLDAAVHAAEGEESARAIALELAARAGRFDEVAGTLATWSDGGDARHTRDRQLAAGLVAERAGQRERAVEAYRAAIQADHACEPAVRAEMDLAPGADAELLLEELAAATVDPLRAALLRLESITRGASHDEPTALARLDAVNKAAPTLPFATFLAERVARHSGNVDEVLRWIRERRTQATDPLESALDAVREALLVADGEPEVASERLAEAHNARPEDVALRELFERLSAEPLTDRASWRETRAQSAVGPSQALLFTEAAYEYERAGDKESFLRAAQAACQSGDTGLGRLALERAEVEAGAAGRLADELLTRARETEDAHERREAYERLADLDAVGRGDPASAVLWHRAILEFEPLHQPSLRYVEHAYVDGGRDGELEPIASSIARALAGSNGGECAAHAELAARLRMKGGADDAWESTREMAELAAAQTEPPLWALRLVNAHARAQKNPERVLMTTLALVPKTGRPAELAALHVRAGDAAAQQDNPDLARGLLERAVKEDPGDVVAWGMLAQARHRSKDMRGAAEAGESLARTSAVPRHQLLAWYDAARMWADDLAEPDRSVYCLEQAAQLDVAYEDVFARLSALYGKRGAREELAALLAKRIAVVSSPEEKVELEVERGRALMDVGDPDGARAALKSALAEKPDHVAALGAYADLCAAASEWDEAEQAWVRLARSVPVPEEQRDVYRKLGELYAVHAVNLARAEVAFKEVLKRAPGDVSSMERLVNVYARQNDAAKAIDMQQQLIAMSSDAEAKRKRQVELASLYDEVGHDARKAEQTLEAVRREAPTDVGILRALAEFYMRHKQMPAVNILLDRAATDARRALVAGRFASSAFEVLKTVYDLRARKDAARVVGSTLAAFEARPSPLRGGDTRAADPRLDDLLAPELLTPALRALLARTGDALDAASPLDLRALQAAQLPASASALQQVLGQLAHQMGVGPVQALVSPKLGLSCVPCGSSPPMIVLGEGLLDVTNDAARLFLLLRALKLVQARASAIVRTPAADMGVLMVAWLQLFNPQWRPDGFDPKVLSDASRRLQRGLPRQLPPDVGVIALEVAGSVGMHGAALGAATIGWANHMALLAIGDPAAAFDGIAWSMGSKDGAPGTAQDRAAWATRTGEVKDLIAFSVTDAYAEARTRLGLDRL